MQENVGKNSSNKEILEADLQCTESEMVLQQNYINDECLKRDNLTTDDLQGTFSSKVRHDRNKPDENLHDFKELKLKWT